MGQKETRGKAKKMKGRLEQAAGIVSGDKDLENKGARLRAEGAVEETLGKASRKVGDLLADAGKSIKKKGG